MTPRYGIVRLLLHDTTSWSYPFNFWTSVPRRRWLQHVLEGMLNDDAPILTAHRRLGRRCGVLPSDIAPPLQGELFETPAAT